MQLFFEIVQIFFTTYMLALIMPIFLIVMFLVYLQYKRQAATEEKLYGRVINPVGRQILFSLGLGILGGLVASMILVFLGLSLEQIGLYFIWPVALLLLLVNPRYLCFSYAGGIVAFMVLFARHILVPLLPALEENFVIDSLLMIHIPALLVLIGLLHLVEAILIFTSGHWGSSPIYLKKDDGEVVGAFSLQRFWPIPLVALMVAVVSQPEIVGVSMPDWWPILDSVIQPGEGQTLQYMVIPVAAGLGYGDMALSSTPREKTALSAKTLALYSVVLLFIAVGAEFFTLLILPGVIFAPVGHELIIMYGKKQEENYQPRYRRKGSEIVIMSVLPGTAADQAGLQQDDIILSVNGASPEDNMDFLKKIEESYFMVLLEGTRNGESFSKILRKQAPEEIDVKRSFKSRLNISRYNSLSLHRFADLGFIPVPDPDSLIYLEISKPDPLERLKKLKFWGKK